MSNTFLTHTEVKGKQQVPQNQDIVETKFIEERYVQLQMKKSMQETAKRRWKQTTEKLTFKPPEDDYYDRLEIKPGFQFFNNIIQGILIKKVKAKFNIPETIYC